ncbi:recombinase RecT [Microbulbifer sp. THAF38]|uniref:recombinase RecT n=1 Tax=Microbulbifer sp. THAF38 TaxID=2587856 RepID=UPI001267F37C|nr:recombinase RecT [Microbulbifer sp. THAF38]QFT57099.1 recombination and repair protein RecT [Microbulbifer sp. THAF38]
MSTNHRASAPNITSELARKEYIAAIEKSAAMFSESTLDFTREKVFAAQQLLKNEFTLKVANNNPSSLKLAMYSVAAVGLTLNPQLGLAYLVPRRDRTSDPFKIVLDISYRGLIEIAVQCGAIISAGAELVCEKDKLFKYRGKFTYPDHDFDPFSSDRGAVRGGYCVAKLPNDGELVEAMSIADMNKARKLSSAYASENNSACSWVTWEDQMQLKTLVKRAYKWWPSPSPRMGKVLQLLNEENGEGLAILAGNSGSNALPPPPDRREVPIVVQNTVKQLVDRAVQQNAFEACRELMGSRIKNPAELSFAYSELDKAKAESEAKMHEQKVVNA